MFNPKLFLPSWLLLAAALLLSLPGCGNSPSKTQAAGKGQSGRGSQSIPVAVAKADRRDVPIYLTGLGSVEAFNTVVIKTRLDGQLVQVAFREGQMVRQGDLLAVIDPRPYEVALQQAEANLYKDQAALKDATLNQQRFQDLYKEGVIPKQQFDTQVSLVGQLEGAVRSDQAQIENQKLNLNYTRITAPVSGRVGLRQVDIGNIVHASDLNGLLVLTQLQPIAATFTLPQDYLPSVAQHMRQGTLAVDAYSRDDQTKLTSGKLLTIDNQIDPSTGTGKLKAVFENRDSSLWPNQFVNAHLLLEVKKNSIVVPAAAIQRGPQGAYVFTVKPDKTVDMRSVTVGYTTTNTATIDSGLSPGEVVVTDGQDKLQPGTRIEIRGGIPGSGTLSTDAPSGSTGNPGSSRKPAQSAKSAQS